jgi:hypothetical protein
VCVDIKHTHTHTLSYTYFILLLYRTTTTKDHLCVSPCSDLDQKMVPTVRIRQHTLAYVSTHKILSIRKRLPLRRTLRSIAESKIVPTPIS